MREARHQTRRRILHTLPDLAVGGGQVIALRHLAHRDEETFDVGVVYFDDPIELLDTFSETGVAMHRLRKHRNRFGTVVELTRLLQRQRIDLLHVHGPSDRKIGLTAACLARVPAVCHIHSEYIHLGPKPPENATWAQKVRARIAAGIRDRVEAHIVAEYVADSEAAAALFRPIVGGKPVTAMELSLPFDAFARAADIDPDDARQRHGIGTGPVLINVSRLVDGKGQDRLVRMLPRILERHPDATLVLVGDGDRRASTEAEAATLGVSDHVRFLGNRFDVPELLRLADVFVFGSRTEALGVAVAEAMGARLPVVAFQLPALETFCAEGVTGYFVNQQDEDGFVAAVNLLLGDPAFATSMGEAAHAAVVHRFHERATADTFEAAYARILGLATPARVETQASGLPMIRLPADASSLARRTS